MAIQREFIGWDAPCLPRAATWLGGGNRVNRGWDLADLIIAVPGARAGRRLLELLVQAADETDAALAPPSIVTTGELAALLFTPQMPIADDLQCLLARIESVRRTPHHVLQAIAADPPDPDDLHRCMELAEELARLYELLSADGVTIDKVAPVCRQLPDFTEDRRWDVLAQMQTAYEHILAEEGLQDPHQARLEAIRDGRCNCRQDIILLAASDLNKITRTMLSGVNSTITALIHAPPQEADHFDELGCLIVDHWASRPINFDSGILHIVDRRAYQMHQTLRTIEAITQTNPSSITPDDITVGLGLDSDAAPLARALELAGIPARTPIDITVGQSRPVTLLAALARFVSRMRLDDFAALLRCPDIQTYLLTVVDKDVYGAIGDWMTLLDRYAADHLQGHLTGRWLGNRATAERLKAVYDAILALLATDHQSALPLPKWSKPIAELLGKVYAHCDLRYDRRSDRQLIDAIEAIAQALRQQAQLTEPGVFVPTVSAAEAIRLTLDRVGRQPIAPPGGTGAVELLGWLELPLDDAPNLIVTGFNEGQIPKNITAHSFLPDQVRTLLGIADNRKRLGRDIMALTAILHSRPHVTLIAARRADDDQPLVPSRLLLACNDRTLAQRIEHFYTDDAPGPAPPLLLAPGKNQFLIPPPKLPKKPLDTLHVTAFRDYLACPYRFYLKYIAKLEPLDDRAVELDGRSFGNLAHQVLADFGRSALAHSTDPRAITDFLSRQLSAHVRYRFGDPDDPASAALVIQTEQLRNRFEMFAVWQAEQVNQGWTIMQPHIETRWQATIEVDGITFTITGRIDRVDEHPDGGYRVMDYKTADTAPKPDKTHRRGPKNDKQWSDLQLPLYHTLLQHGGLEEPIALGYVALPKDMAQIGFQQAPWSSQEIGQALDEAHRIIGAIRHGIFWPPNSPPNYDDGFAFICMDDCMQRNDAILAAHQPGTPSEPQR